jgi:hypothetical protein
MLDEIAGQAIPKIPPSSTSCARWSDEKFSLNRTRRENLAKNPGLHQPNILGRGGHEFRVVHDIELFNLVHGAKGYLCPYVKQVHALDRARRLRRSFCGYY